MPVRWTWEVLLIAQEHPAQELEHVQREIVDLCLFLHSDAEASYAVLLCLVHIELVVTHAEDLAHHHTVV